MNVKSCAARVLALGVCLVSAPPLHADKVKVDVDGVRRELRLNILSALSLRARTTAS